MKAGKSFNGSSSITIIRRDFAESPVIAFAHLHLFPPRHTIHSKLKLKIKFDPPECLRIRPWRWFTSKTISSTDPVNMKTLQTPNRLVIVIYRERYRVSRIFSL